MEVHGGSQPDVESDDGFVTMSCGHKLALASAACYGDSIEVRSMPVVEGFVGERQVSVLRDSGCGTVAVSRRFVAKEDLLVSLMSVS